MNNNRSPFLEQVRQAIRVRHYSIRTEQAYVGWVKRFILFHQKRHPRDMGEAEVSAFLTYLALNRNVAANTQNQALNALVFTYKVVLKQPLGDIIGAVRAKKPKKLPVVLTQEEVKRVLSELNGFHWLACCLMYGSGLRLMECVRLRVKDLDLFRSSGGHCARWKGPKRPGSHASGCIEIAAAATSRYRQEHP